MSKKEKKLGKLLFPMTFHFKSILQTTHTTPSGTRLLWVSTMKQKYGNICGNHSSARKVDLSKQLILQLHSKFNCFFKRNLTVSC